MSNCQLCGKQWHIREHDDYIRILFENYLIITFNLVMFNKKKRFDYRTAIFALEKWPYIQNLASFPLRHIISSTAFFNESPDVKLLLLVSCTYQWSYLITFVTTGYVYRTLSCSTRKKDLTIILPFLLLKNDHTSKNWHPSRLDTLSHLQHSSTNRLTWNYYF